jgi:GTPase involved in cell partitioning and DNA repair
MEQIKISIVGLKNSGKTTLFNALNNQQNSVGETKILFSDNSDPDNIQNADILLKVIRDTSNPEINPLIDYQKIQEELKKTDVSLLQKPEILVLNVEKTAIGLSSLQISNFDQELIVICAKEELLGTKKLKNCFARIYLKAIQIINN